MEQIIKAQSFTHAVDSWLVNSYHPKILHIFDHVCNLINERREFLSIVTPQIGNGPFHIVLEKDILFSEQLRVESTVSILDGQLQVGDLIVKVNNVKHWNPRPAWDTLHEKRDSIIDQLLILPPIDYQPSIPNPLLAVLTSSIVTSDLQSSVAAAKRLAGLGVGLTPSGDDFIMGAIYAAWIIHPFEMASLLVSNIAESAAPLTTSLSMACLKSAGRGDAGTLWHEFFDALVTNEDLEASIAKILSVGETSGADALSGFLSVMSVFKGRIIDECPS